MSPNDKAAVDPDYFWQPISTCPTGTKVQLLNRAGIGSTGKITSNKDGWWIAWAPMPKIPPEIKALIEPTYRPSNIGSLIGD